MNQVAAILIIGVHSLLTASPRHVNLPREPGSPAELLSASHLFSVELTAMSATAWAKGADGLEHRRQTMDFRLLERFKGDLDVKAGDSIHVGVPQNREPGLAVSDFHGFWSHAEVHKGGRYLVIANGVMQEPAIVGLLPEALTADVRAALAAEQILAAPHADAGARAKARLKVLDNAYVERARVQGLFGRYLWVRIEPAYATAEDELYPRLSKIFAARDATVELRQSLIEGVFTAVTADGTGNPHALKLAHALLALLTQPEAAPLMEGLTQAEMYNLIFNDDGTATAPASTLVPDPAQRTAMRAALAKYPSQRANEIAAWLAK